MRFGISSLAWQSPFCDPMGQFEKAKKYGLDIYEIAAEDFSLINVEDILKAKEATGIGTPSVCGAFGETRDVSSDLPEYRREGLQYIKDMVDLTAAIGGDTVVGPMYSAVGKARAVSPEEKKQAWAWAVEYLQEAADYAKDKGIRLGIETLNRFETDFINTVDQAAELIDRIGRDNVGFMLDTFHLNIEESNIIAAIKRTGGKIYDIHACANTRGIPGEDHFDWPAMAAALKEVGYDDYCVIESFTPECEVLAKSASVWRPFAESPEAIAERGIPFLRKIFA